MPIEHVFDHPVIYLTLSFLHRDIILTITYAVVAFSIVVQGLAVGKLVEAAKGV